MELSPLRVTLWPDPLERTQSPPDCFKQPRSVDSDPLAPELVVLWLLPGVVCVLLGGVCCCC